MHTAVILSRVWHVFPPSGFDGSDLKIITQLRLVILRSTARRFSVEKQEQKQEQKQELS
jgi:hypothetical protein